MFKRSHSTLVLALTALATCSCSSAPENEHQPEVPSRVAALSQGPIWQAPCWLVSGNQAITVSAECHSAAVTAKCFRGSSAIVWVWDAAQGSYLANGVSVPVNGDGTFSYSVSGCNQNDAIYALAYDPSDGVYTNHANWTGPIATKPCPPW